MAKCQQTQSRRQLARLSSDNKYDYKAEMCSTRKKRHVSLYLLGHVLLKSITATQQDSFIAGFIFRCICIWCIIWGLFHSSVSAF
jgi:hypothetical protein